MLDGADRERAVHEVPNRIVDTDQLDTRVRQDQGFVMPKADSGQIVEGSAGLEAHMKFMGSGSQDFFSRTVSTLFSVTTSGIEGD
jgi:hypothetical protein